MIYWRNNYTLTFLDWLAHFYIFEGYRLHFLGVVWFTGLFIFTFRKFWKDQQSLTLRSFMRTSVLSFMMSYFLHVFYDLWVLVILFVGGNPMNNQILRVVPFANRLSANLLFFTAIYWMLSYPAFNSDFPTLTKIRITGNKKFILMNIIILLWHLILYYFGVFTLDRATNTFTRFYSAYLPMKILWFISYWSIWKK